MGSTNILGEKAPEKLPPKTAYLIASGDLREAANVRCWPAQEGLEQAASRAFAELGWTLRRAHAIKQTAAGRHGFIDSQTYGRDVFSEICPDSPIVVAEAVWQYSHHVLAGLIRHRAPILLLANWSGEWPGLVGALNLRGSLTKAGQRYSFLWSEDFGSQDFLVKLQEWCSRGEVTHDMSHAMRLDPTTLPVAATQLGERLAAELQRRFAILGVFDEGCMGMFNAIVPDHLLHSTGVFKERLSQSALYYAMTQVSDEEAQDVREWYRREGMQFKTGPSEVQDLTEHQILQQCKMYVAAARLADEFGCDAIGIQYQQGLKDLAPASDLAEGTLNCSHRPPVRRRNGTIIREGEPITHFNEVDECSGLDALITHRVWRALNMLPDNTLHDLRWGDHDQSGTTSDYVWVFEISGSAPPSHFARGWRDAIGERQPPMYFRLGGSTIKGISRPGEIVWSRIYIADNALHMDLGRGKAVELPLAETERRWNATTSQWPILHAVLPGISRDQMMAKHQANHIQVVYADNWAMAIQGLQTKAAMAAAMGIQVNLCGDVEAK